MNNLLNKNVMDRMGLRKYLKLLMFYYKHNFLFSPFYRLKLKLISPFYNVHKTGKAPNPQSLIFEPTAKCNLKCKMCYLDKRKTLKNSELSVSQIKTLFDKLPKTIVRTILVGGEPLLREDIEEICDYISKKGISIRILTNGTFPEKIKELIKNESVTNITLSIDGNKKIHNKMRGSKLVFDKVIESLSILNKQNKKGNCYVHCMLSEENVYHITDLIKLLGKFENIRLISLGWERRFFIKDVRETKKILGLTSKDFTVRFKEKLLFDGSFGKLKLVLDNIENSAKKYRKTINYLPLGLRRDLEFYCKREIRNNYKVQCNRLPVLRINAQGQIVACEHIKRSFGNMLETSFKDIWNSKKYQLYRKKLLENNLLPICEPCLHCQPIKDYSGTDY